MRMELPEGWAQEELDELFNLTYGKGLKTDELKEEGFDVYGANGIIGKYSKYSFEDPQVIISCRGAASGVIHKTNPKSFVTSNSIVLDRKSKDLLNLDFVKYAMIVADKTNVITGTAQPQITIQLLKNLKIVFPPLPEQERIVAKLDSIFTHLETAKQGLEKIPVLLKQFRQAVLTQAVTGKLTEGIDQLGNYDVKIKTGPFGSAVHKSDYIINGIPLINPSHLLKGEIVPDYSISVNKSKSEELSNFKLKNNDVILGRRGEMGRVAVYKEELGEMLCGTGSIVLACGKNIDPEYLAIYLRSPFCVNYLNENSIGSTMINLNQKIIKSLPYPKLTIREQTEIVRRVEALFSKADTIEAQYKKLKEKIDQLPQAILAKAFRGEV